MTFNDKIKILKRAIARYGLFGSSWLFNHLPYKVVKVIARVFMFIGYFFVIRQKKIAMESLNIALGRERSQEDLKHIARQCFKNLGQGMMELIYFMGHPSMIKEKVYFEGKENLDQAFNQGKGVIAVSAHFGSFPLMLLRCAQEGYKTNAIIRPARANGTRSSTSYSRSSA
jgi:KDO2-lipid IV(A) lauroyltransferase